MGSKYVKKVILLKYNHFIYKPMLIQSSPIVLIHLCIILPCAVFGTYLIFAKKGTQFHNTIGKVYMVLMGITGVLTLFIPAQVGLRIFNHFGLLHLLSLLTMYSVPKAWLAIKRGDVKTHKSAMIQLYIGGIIVAGSFAILAPGRYLFTLFFN
jgi:uncharacterized membrane protein